MPKISVFTVMLPDLTPEEAAPTLKSYGYDGVEWRVTTVPQNRRQEEPSFWGNNLCTLAPTTEEAERARAVAGGAGLAIPGLGTYIDVGDIAATENAMQFAQTCGASHIRVSPGKWPSGKSYAESFETAKDFLTEVENLGRKYGVKALVEIHHKTITCSASLARRLVSHFDPEFIGVIHDAGNMVYEGYENYRLGIELLGPYLAHVHIKNAAYRRPDGGGVWQCGWAPLEDGVVDWDELLTALRDAGYEGWLGMEDFSGTRPTHEALQHNITFLKNQIDRIYS